MPTATPFNNLITFSRGSNATVTGSNGLIQWAPNNLLTNSEQFDNAAWTKLNATIIPNLDLSNSPPGPELVNNGDFSAGSTGWSAGANTTITGGGAVSTATPVSGNILQQNTVQPGANKWLQVSFDITSWTGGNLLFYINDASTFVTGANGRVTFFFLSRFASGVGLLFRAETSAFTGTIDNISVREVIPAAATAPDGTRTADTMVTSGAAVAQRLGQNPVNTGVSTFSIYVKAGTAQFVQILHGSDGNAFANFDVGSGALGTRGTGASSTITDVGNGWYRCTITFNIASSTFWYVYIVSSASAVYGATFTATVASLLIWGAQLELGSTATTYNPTTVKNLLGFSEAFDNAAWTKTRVSVVTGAAANPVNGLFNAQKLMEDTTASNTHFVAASVTTTAAPNTLSVYAKASERSWVYIRIADSSNIARVVWFNIGSGAVGTTGFGITASIQNIGNGWYRCTATIAAAFAGGQNPRIGLASADNVETYTGDGNSGVYIYGAQLSDSASLDPYVPTPGAAPSSTAFYGPRFDFDPVTRAPRGLLVEEQRTNLVLYSDDFANAAWTKENATATANATAAPDGATTADRLNASAGVGVHSTYTATAITVATGTNATSTIYVKKGTHRFVYLTQSVSVAHNFTAIFDLDGGGSTATQTGVGSLSGTIASTSQTDVGNGWFRLSVTGSATGASRFVAVGFAQAATGNTIDNVGNVTYTAAGTETIFLWGAQLEAGAFATSYIPTVASTVTRSADVALISGQNFGQWYNQSAGSFVVDADSYTVSTTDFVLTASDGTSNNRFGLYRSSPNIGGYVVTGNVTQMDLTRTPVAANTPYRAAVAATLNDGNTALNGSLAAGDTSITMGTLDRLSIGANNGAGFISGHIRNIRFIPARAADFQLQGLST